MSSMMGKTIAIVQSNYIPWKGYFDLIARSDEFILYDDAQYTRRDWRNRNKIKTKDGLKWLTVPVEVKGKFTQSIFDTRLADRSWIDKHASSIRHAYSKAPYFSDYFSGLTDVYERCRHMERLSEVNCALILWCMELLDLDVPVRTSREFELRQGRSERLLAMCEQAGATRYLSGPAAAGYLDVTAFQSAGIEVEWIDYSGYPEYEQLHGPFEHAVSVIDLLFNCGPDSRRYMKS